MVGASRRHFFRLRRTKCCELFWSAGGGELVSHFRVSSGLSSDEMKKERRALYSANV